MEFKKGPVVISKVAQTLADKGIEEICRSGVSDYQKAVIVMSGKTWERIHFCHFQSEYDNRGKTIAYSLYPCKDEAIGYRDEDRAIDLEVEWHRTSNMRFLIAIDRHDRNGIPFYVDYWEVNKT
ncbi:MAG: hypothetical protein WC657_02975 [Candidatus Paceibacterota bacterium]|jgi:hypothetical protein